MFFRKSEEKREQEAAAREDVERLRNLSPEALAVREALQRLEHANLVMQMASGVDNATHWRITSTGEQALAARDVAQRLGVTA